jgi:hypothetical protein
MTDSLEFDWELFFESNDYQNQEHKVKKAPVKVSEPAVPCTDWEWSDISTKENALELLVNSYMFHFIAIIFSYFLLKMILVPSWNLLEREPKPKQTWYDEIQAVKLQNLVTGHVKPFLTQIYKVSFDAVSVWICKWNQCQGTWFQCAQEFIYPTSSTLLQRIKAYFYPC